MSRQGKELINLAVISLDEGRMLGRIQDIYLDPELAAVAGLFMGSQGVIKRKSTIIPRDAIVVLGIDAVLVRDGNVVTDDQTLSDAKTWVRRDKLAGRELDTPGGTKLGIVGDVLIELDGSVSAFSLSRVHVEGPLSESRLVNRQAVLDTGQDSGRMTADLSVLEIGPAEMLPAADTTVSDPTVGATSADPLQVTVEDEPKQTN